MSGAATPHAVSGASWGAAPQQKMTNLFNSIDTTGSGSITQAQFQQAFASKNPPAVFQQQGANATFAALDPSGSGSVSKQAFVSGMSQMMASLRAESPAAASPSGAASATASLAALNQTGAAPATASTAPGARLDYQG